MQKTEMTVKELNQQKTKGDFEICVQYVRWCKMQGAELVGKAMAERQG